MRIHQSAPRLLFAFLALTLGAAACGAPDETAVAETPQSPAAAKVSQVKNEKPPVAPVADTVPRFQDPTALKVTLDELRTLSGVLLRNPRAGRKVRLAVADSMDDMPLSRVLKPSADLVPVGGGTRARPRIAMLRLKAVDDTARLIPGDYLGHLVAEDSAGTELARRGVVVSVPEPAVMQAANATWTTEVFKFAPLSRLRARTSETSELRCAKDQRTPGIFPEWTRKVMGPCVRDNEIPVRIVGPWAWPRGADSVARRQPMLGKDSVRRHARVLLGVLQQKDSIDRAVVWWTGTPIDSGGPGEAAGVQLDFTSLDHPGEYRGTVSLASVGGTGEVELRVRVTHDWPYVVLAIFMGVWLSTWLRSYVRTRRAVLELEETRVRLVSTIEATDLAFRALDRPLDGKHPYEVDAALLGELHRMDLRIRRHARDRTPLEPGSDENQKLRGELDTCEKQVAAWEKFLDVLQALRCALDHAARTATTLSPESPEPGLFKAAEERFAGSTLTTEQLAAVHQQVEASCRLITSWGEVADGALALRNAGAVPTSKVEKQAAAGRELDAAVQSLFDAETAGAVDGVSTKLGEIKVRLGTAQPWFGQRMANAVRLGRNVASPAAGGDSAEEAAAAAEAARVRLVPREIASLGVPIPFRNGKKMVWAWGVVARSDPGERERSARQGRQVNDAFYFVVTTVVAVLTGFNELYLDSFGFGTMRDYLLAVLWGFGAKLGIDTVRVAVEGGRIPWPGRKDGAPQQTPVQQTPASQTPAAQTPAAQQPGTQQPGTQQPASNTPKPSSEAAHGEGDPETDGEPAQAPGGERVRDATELAAAG